MAAAPQEQWHNPEIAAHLRHLADAYDSDVRNRQFSALLRQNAGELDELAASDTEP